MSDWTDGWRNDGVEEDAEESHLYNKEIVLRLLVIRKSRYEFGLRTYMIKWIKVLTK